RINGPCSALLEPIRTQSSTEIAAPEPTDFACNHRRRYREPHPAALRYWNIARQRHHRCSGAMLPGFARLCRQLPPGVLRKMAENPGFSSNRRETRTETDCLLEGDGFELAVRGRDAADCRPFCAARRAGSGARSFWRASIFCSAREGKENRQRPRAPWDAP